MGSEGHFKKIQPGMCVGYLHEYRAWMGPVGPLPGAGGYPPGASE